MRIGKTMSTTMALALAISFAMGSAAFAQAAGGDANATGGSGTAGSETGAALGGNWSRRWYERWHRYRRIGQCRHKCGSGARQRLARTRWQLRQYYGPAVHSKVSRRQRRQVACL